MSIKEIVVSPSEVYDPRGGTWKGRALEAESKLAELQAQVDRMKKVLKERVPRSVYEAAILGDKP